MSKQHENEVLAFMRSRIGQKNVDGISPLGVWLGGTLTVVEEGALTAEFVIHEQMTNPLGNIHGGALAALIDEMIGATVFSLGGKTVYMSVNLNIDFLKPASLNTIITAQTNILRQGKRLVHGECFVYDQEDDLVAKGSANLIATKHTF